MKSVLRIMTGAFLIAMMIMYVATKVTAQKKLQKGSCFADSKSKSVVGEVKNLKMDVSKRPLNWRPTPHDSSGPFRVEANGKSGGQRERVDNRTKTAYYGFQCQCTGLDYDPTTWQVIECTDVFGTSEGVYSGVEYTNLYEGLTVSWQWVDPDSNVYHESSYDIPDPPEEYWEWFRVINCFDPIDEYTMADMEGLWRIRYYDSGNDCSEYFTVRYGIEDHTMCKGVQSEEPWDPIDSTHTFLPTDEAAYSWLMVDNPTESLQVKWEWKKPNGDPYSKYIADLEDPRSYGYRFWDWYKAWCSILIAGYEPAFTPGQWIVDVSIRDIFGNWDREYTEYFTIGEETEITVRAEDTEGSPGDTEVEMYISLNSPIPITMLSCTVSESLDSSNYLRPTGMVPTGRATTVTAMSFIPYDNSVDLMIGTFPEEPIPAGTGFVMKVSYEIDPQTPAGIYNFVLTNVQVINGYGEPQEAVIESGIFTVKGPVCPSPGYPEAGTDAFMSTAGIQVYFGGIGAAVITLEGETVVRRSEPYQGSDELTTIDMEIIAMELTGSDPYLGPVSLMLNPQDKTFGQIQQMEVDAESPMESFFDVFVQLYTEMGLFYHVEPIRMQATIESIPPRAGVYEFAGEQHISLYSEDGLEVGYIVNVKHVTQPYRDRFQSTAIFNEIEILGLGIDTEVVVTGPAEAVRGDWVPGIVPPLYEGKGTLHPEVARSDWASGVVTTEMVEMELVGSGFNIGQITITEDPSKISTGQVVSLDAVAEFPAFSSFYINFQIETDHGTGFACAPVEAIIDSFPPIGAEYIGPHDVDIVDEHGEVIGRIRGGFVHIPEEPLEPPPISTLPPAGWDCFDSEAQLTLLIDQNQETILLTGPTIVSRGAPSDLGDGLPEISTEIIFMVLEGTSIILGGPIIIAECDNPSPGTIKQLKPELGLPAISDFTVNFDLLTPYGTYWGQQAQVIALIDRIPPENEEYQGPHPVVIVDPTTGEDIGQIIDFVHIPRGSIPCPDPYFPVPCPPCEGGERSDANRDGIIDVLDALTVVLDILNILPCQDMCLCDCNCDGVINVLDVLCIVNIILQLITPDTGLDCMMTTAEMTLQIGEMTVQNVVVTGATVVSRGTPYDPDDGRDKIDTEILSMDLIGTCQFGEVTVTQSPDRASTGYIQAKQTQRDFPAESFFDVYVEVDIPDVGTVHNEDPIPMRAKIDKIPPVDRVYYPPYEVEIPVYGLKGDLLGYIIHVTHSIDYEIECPSIEVPKRGRSSVIIEVPETYTQVDEKVLLPISVKSEEPIAGVQFTLSHNPNALNPLTPQLTERSAEMELASDAANGELVVLLYSLEGKTIPSGEGPILKVPLEIAEGACGDDGLAFKEVIVAGKDCRRALPAEVGPICVRLNGSSPEVTPRAEILQSYPNPFNPTATIHYSLVSEQAPAHVTLKIYNILGQEIRTLVDEVKEPGYYTVHWDGTDGNGNDVTSGVYLYRFQARSFVSTKRMVLIR